HRLAAGRRARRHRLGGARHHVRNRDVTSGPAGRAGPVTWSNIFRKDLHGARWPLLAYGLCLAAGMAESLEWHTSRIGARLAVAISCPWRRGTAWRASVTGGPGPVWRAAA